MAEGRADFPARRDLEAPRGVWASRDTYAS
jgi:hypothetical protein